MMRGINLCKGMIFLIKDISKIKKLELEMQNVRNLYFSQITHELRTPLVSIMPIIENLKPYISDSRGADLLKVVRNSAHHLSNIVNDILDMSRIENGKFEIQKEEVNIRSTLNEVYDILELQAK